MPTLRDILRFGTPACALLLFAACASTDSSGRSDTKKGDAAMPTGQLTRSFHSQATGKERQYGMFVPPEYSKSKKQKWPVLLFLHGMGECGEDPQLLLKHGPLKEALFRPSMPFIIVAPQSPKRTAVDIMQGNGWEFSEADILHILDEVKRDYRVDEDRIYLTGISMGGFGSFGIAARNPGMFAAVAPICGGGRPENAPKYAGTPFWIFHGAKDRVVPINRSQEMVDAMKAAGVDVRFTIYPEADHDSWTVTYQNDELYKWFLSHKLGGDKGGKKPGKTQ